MSPSRFSQTLFLWLALTAVSSGPAVAQIRLWRSFEHKSTIKFDWNCAETSWHPNGRLADIVQAAFRRNDDGPPKYGDRAFAFDLDGDGNAELFVPLTCGATGNCGWAVLSARPARLLGVISGQYVYIHHGRHRWPTIITYGHLSVVEGSLTTYRYHKRKYRALPKTYAINFGDFDLDIQGGRGHKMPLFLNRARPACSAVGN